MNTLPWQVRVRLACALVEGSSLRAIVRQTGVHRTTLQKWLLQAGEACKRFHNARTRSLYCTWLELDEVWTFVHTKEGHLTPDSHPEHGDQYVFVALDAGSRLVVSYLVAKRTAASTRLFCADVRSRVLGRPQVTTDGFRPYRDALEDAFGRDIHYATAVKVFANEEENPEQRYAPGRVISVEKRVVSGSPDESRITTSHAERNNLTLRTDARRFTRLSLGFSKSLRHLEAAVSLHYAAHNWTRVNATTRVTPAMEAGLTDRVWSIAELLEMALTEAEPPPLPAVPTIIPKSQPVLRVIEGGRK